MRETGRYGGTLFLGIAEEDGELLDSGHRDVPAIVAGQKGLFGNTVSHALRIGRSSQKLSR